MVKKFKCSRCTRRFSMAAHLARHMATHGVKSKGNVSGRRSRRGPGRPRGSRNATHSTVASIGGESGIVRLINEMDAYRDQLAVQLDALNAEIQSVDAAMDAISGSIGASAGDVRRGRPSSAIAGQRINAALTRARRRVKIVGTLHTGGKRQRGRPTGSTTRNTGGSLKQAIVKVLRRSPRSMSPKQIASAVQTTGYKSYAADLTKLISNTLPEIDLVKKIGRGQYQI